MDLPVLKGRFPFRLSAPSFIYPAGYVENVRRLGPHVDEIELLFFESAPGSLPEPPEIDALARAAQELQLTYNVHLPIDLDLGHGDPTVRFSAVDRLTEVLNHCKPLHATTHTLHLSYGSAEYSDKTIADWQNRTIESLALLLGRSTVAAEQLSIETLDYPPEWLAPFLAAFPLAVCLDVGHLLHHGRDVAETLHALGDRTTIVHLHAAAQGHDHQALDALPPLVWEVLAPFLSTFRGTLSLELFSPERLAISMGCLEEVMHRYRSGPS